MNLETTVLRCLSEDLHQIDDTDLSEYCFSSAHHKKVFASFQDLRDSGFKGSVSLVDLSSLKGIVPVHILTEILSADVALSRFKFYEKEVIREYKKRELRATFSELSAELSEAVIDPDDLSDKAIQRISEIGESSQKTKLVHLSEWIPGYQETVSKRVENDGDISGLSTGYRNLDIALNGLLPGITILSGRPGSGKSAALINLSLNVSEYHPVCYFSAESPQTEFMDRCTANLSGIDSRIIQSGSMQRHHLQYFHEAQEKLKNRKLFVYEKPGMTITEIRSIARKAVRDHGVKLLAVDYAQIIFVPGAKDMTHRVREVSSQLRQLAVDLEVPVLLACQMSRSAEGSSPDLRHLEHASSLEQDSHVVILFDQKSDDPIRPNIDWIIRKSRNGRLGRIHMQLHKPTLTFREAG